MKKILLVEDDSLLSNIYVLKLEEAGFEVEVAFTGEEALSMIKKEQFDLILLDIVLPDITGWEILEKSKKEIKTKAKIIILSNLSQKEEKEKGEQLGADHYFVKAYYTPAELIEEIKKII